MGLRKPDKTDYGTGIVLPELTNPAAAENIESGFEAIDENGVKMTGTASIPAYTVEYIELTENLHLASKTIVTTNPKKSSCKVYGGGYSSRSQGVAYLGTHGMNFYAEDVGTLGVTTLNGIFTRSTSSITLISVCSKEVTPFKGVIIDY